MARECLRGDSKDKREGVTVKHVGGREITTIRGAAAMKSIATKRSEVDGRR